jgi:P4 family phage/plasmid primase-like protien
VTIDTDALLARVSLVDVVGHYVQLKKMGGELRGLCPFHDDHTPSFYVIPKKGFAHCFSCGWSGDAIGFIREKEGLDFLAAVERLGGNVAWKPTITPEPKAPIVERVTSKPPPDAGTPNMRLRELGEPVRIWPYRDAEGDILGYVCRYEVKSNGDKEPKKEIRCWTWGARGVQLPCWSVGAFSKPRPLYSMERLAARPTARALIVEGEKTADAAQALFPANVAITWPGGAQAWKHADWATLWGKGVTLCADADTAGWQAMEGIAALLHDHLECDVRVIDTNRMPEGWDLHDMLVAGLELADPKRTDQVGWTPAQALEWARPRIRTWGARGSVADAQTENAAPQLAPSTTNAAPGETPCGGEENARGAGGPSSEVGVSPAAPFLPQSTPPVAAPVPQVSKEAPEPPNAASAAVARPKAIPEAAEPDDPLLVVFEDRTADRFAAAREDSVRYVAERNKWYLWADDYWKPDAKKLIDRLVVEFARGAMHWRDCPYERAAKEKFLLRRFAGNVRDLVQHDRRIAIEADAFDRDPFLLGVPGGVVDLHIGKVIEAEREQLISRQCAVSPVAGPHPLFDSVLARADGGDATMRHYLWKWLGYFLTGDCREEQFIFLRGDEGSGKGTLVRTIATIMGTYAWATSMDTLTESLQSRHPTSIAALNGPRLIYASETNIGRSWNEALINQLTGRDKVNARHMRQDEFEYDMRGKLLVYGNYRPHLKGGGMGMKRRIKMVEYIGKLSAEEVDTGLKDKLIAEYPAILASMIQGCIAWQREGLGEPEAISNNVASYLDAEDSFGGWLEERIIREQNNRESMRDLYADFKGWAQRVNEYLPAAKRFSQLLEARGFNRYKSGSERGFVGLRLTHPAPVSSSRYPD